MPLTMGMTLDVIGFSMLVVIRRGELDQLAGVPRLDLLLQLHNAIDKRVGARWATRYVDVHRYDLVDALDDGVIVIDPARGGAGAHRDHPFGVRHLVVYLPEDRSHLRRDAPRHDHHIRLPRRRSKNFRAEPGDIE